MDSERFDDLTRALASGVSRRQTLKLLGGSLAGGLMVFLGIGEAGADPPGCKREGKNCTRHDQCCSGTCCNTVCCAAGQVCQDGQCVAPPTGNQLICRCNEGQTLNDCFTEPCNVVAADAICDSLCAPLGGVASAECTPNSCTP